MILPSALSPGRRRRWLAAIVATGLVIGGVSWALASSAGAAGAIRTGRLAQFRTAVIERMHAENLRFLWVACVRSGNRFRGVPVVRCNVDFGEPHIVAYCSVFRDGRLLTSEEDASIPCRHDDAGFSDPVVTY